MKEEEIRPTALFNQFLELSKKDINHFFANKASFLNVPCPACASTQFENAFTKFDFRYVTCNRCDSLYVSPRPTEKMITMYYQNSSAVKFFGTHFYKETERARRETIFRPRAKLLKEFIKDNPSISREVMIDIGCGYGAFLEEIRDLNFCQKVTGIEPAPSLAKISRSKGFMVLEKTMESVREHEVKADLMTCFEVIEHLFDPYKFLSSVKSALTPSGMFLFTTLTVSGFDIQVLWEHSKSVYPPHHINLISIEGMKRLLERSGFNIMELATPGELDLDILKNFSTENPQIKLPRFINSLIKLDPKGCLEFQRFLQKNVLSSHIRVFCNLPKEN